jgi:hypothetical protein
MGRRQQDIRFVIVIVARLIIYYVGNHGEYGTSNCILC